MDPMTQDHRTPDEEIRAHLYAEGAQAMESVLRSATLVAPMSRLVQAVHGHPAYVSCRGQATDCVRIHPDLSQRPLGMDPDAPPAAAIPVPDPVPVPRSAVDLAASWPTIADQHPLPELDPMGYGDGSGRVLG